MNQEKWRDFYRKADRNITWVKVMLSNGDHHFFCDHKDWLSVKTFCDNFGTKVSEMELQFRSHCVKIDIPSDAKGFYFVPSVMGVWGGDSKNYFTIGTFDGEKVNKKMWLVPELISEKSMQDGLENCIEEAMVFYEEEEKNKQE